MSIVDMRGYLAAKYSKRWVETKTDEEVLRIYHRILASEEKKQKGVSNNGKSN